MLSYLPLAHILERLNSEVRLYAVGSPVWFASAMAEMPADIHELRPTCFVGRAACVGEDGGDHQRRGRSDAVDSPAHGTLGHPCG